MTATIIVNNDRCSGEYAMFDVHSFDSKDDVHSAELAGPLFLEIGETLTLRVDTGEVTIDLVAKVHAVSNELMTVRFDNLAKEGKVALLALLENA